VLRAAAARAGGVLTALDVSGCGTVERVELLAVVFANLRSLRELRCEPAHLLCGAAEVLSRAAPQLAVTPVRSVAGRTPAVARASKDLYHDNNKRFTLRGVPLAAPAAIDAVVDSLLAHETWDVTLHGCALSPACAPALARLLRGNSELYSLKLSSDGDGDGTQQLLDAPAAALLGDALRQHAHIAILALSGVGLWRDTAAAVTLLSALKALPKLRLLFLSNNAACPREQLADDDAAQRTTSVPEAVSTALAAMVAADSPALTWLDVSACGLGDDALGALMNALAANNHLRHLDVSDNGMSDAFARGPLLAAVRANTSLRTLRLDFDLCEGAGAEAVAHVEARRDALSEGEGEQEGGAAEPPPPQQAGGTAQRRTRSAAVSAAAAT
jgi:hypothetical protein